MGFIEINAMSVAKVMVLQDYCIDSDIFGCYAMSLKGAESIARVYMAPKNIMTSIWLTGQYAFFLYIKKAYCDTGGNPSFNSFSTRFDLASIVFNRFGPKLNHSTRLNLVFPII